MSTIEDVAKAAGVSIATVSRVVNNPSSVSDRTRSNVLKAIEDLSYKPNLLGRYLRRTESKMILVVLTNYDNPIYPRIVKGIEDVAHKNGYNVMLCNTDADKERERSYLELLKNRLADGVILMETELCEDELLELSNEYTVVQCNEYREYNGACFVSIDNFSAAYKAVSHLINLNHKSIGLITCDNDVISRKQREAGYKKALEDAGIEFSPSLVALGDYTYKSGMRAAKMMLSLNERPSAIFAISDIMAIGAINSMEDAGLRVPEDIAVVGFDDIDYSTMCKPSLTTISQPKYYLGCTAMELLIKKIRGEVNEPVKMFMDYEFKIRRSTVK